METNYKEKYEEAIYTLMLLTTNDYFSLGDRIYDVRSAVSEEGLLNENMTSWDNPWVDQFNSSLEFIKYLLQDYRDSIGEDKYRELIKNIQERFSKPYLVNGTLTPPLQWITDLKLNALVYLKRYNRQNWIPARVMGKTETLVEVSSCIDHTLFSFDYQGNFLKGPNIGEVVMVPYNDD